MNFCLLPQATKLDKHLASVPIPTAVLYVYCKIEIIKYFLNHKPFQEGIYSYTC